MGRCGHRPLRYIVKPYNLWYHKGNNNVSRMCWWIFYISHTATTSHQCISYIVKNRQSRMLVIIHPFLRASIWDCLSMRASSKCRTPAFLSENVSSSELTALANVRSYGAILGKCRCTDACQMCGLHGTASLQVSTSCPTIYHAVVTDSIVNVRKEVKCYTI